MKFDLMVTIFWDVMPLWFGRQKNPCTGLGSPRVFQEVEASRISVQSAH